MRKIFLLTILTTALFSTFNANVTPITPDIKERMVKGHSWHRGCPVPLKNLRYVNVMYHSIVNLCKYKYWS